VLVKRMQDHNVVDSPICGIIREIIIGNDYERLNLALSVNIGITTAHYHKGFDEIYFVLDGSMKLLLHDPSTVRTWTEDLGPNELAMIPSMVHHKIIEVTPENRLCLITIPRFSEDDQHVSDVI
jgi:mannose-6-phosphate isomerase-like protein (cupin superfamily)